MNSAPTFIQFKSHVHFYMKVSKVLVSLIKLYQAYVGSTKSISLSVEEILVTDRETNSSSYFDDEED